MLTPEFFPLKQRMWLMEVKSVVLSPCTLALVYLAQFSFKQLHPIFFTYW